MGTFSQHERISEDKSDFIQIKFECFKNCQAWFVFFIRNNVKSYVKQKKAGIIDILAQIDQKNVVKVQTVVEFGFFIKT